MKVSIEGHPQGHFLTLFVPVFFIFCAYMRPKYQVSVYRTIGPLVVFSYENDLGPGSRTDIDLHYSHIARVKN